MFCFQWQAVRRASYEENYVARLQHPCLGGLIPMAEIGPAHGDGDGLALTGLQGYTLEALELFLRTLNV